MKIQITKNSTDITIDASNVNSLRELSSAIETALQIQGYTKEDIDEVFNRYQDNGTKVEGDGILQQITNLNKFEASTENNSVTKEMLNDHVDFLATAIQKEQGTLTEVVRYYYPKKDDGSLLKECKHHKHSMSCFGDVAMIGSIACGNCMFNQGIDNEAGWVKCSKIKEVLGVGN